eukprot:15206.XXX_1457152_1456735_1 [CDS] Oithona nana genome sequencing.
MFKALGLSWAFVGIILAILSSSQAKPNPYYSLYGGHQAPIRPSASYGWTQQAAAGIPSNAAIEVPYSYFVEEPRYDTSGFRPVRQYYQRRSSDSNADYEKRKLPLVRLRRAGGEA